MTGIRIRRRLVLPPDLRFFDVVDGLLSLMPAPTVGLLPVAASVQRARKPTLSRR
ncbi:hypothetical protein [Micromonospora sp. NPDC004704]